MVSFVVTVAVVNFAVVFALAIFVVDVVFFVGGVEVGFDGFPLLLLLILWLVMYLLLPLLLLM